MKQLGFRLVAGFTAALIAGAAWAAPVTQQRLLAASPSDDGADWLSHGRDYNETRFSPLTQVDAGNVSRLGLAWSFNLETTRGLESTPLVIDGRMYVTGAWSKVYALDARDGRLLWQFDPQVPRSLGWKACCDVVNRGVAAWGERIFVGTLDGRLIALDANTGAKRWDVQTTDPAQPQSITGAPRAFNGKVVIGNSGAEFGVRGYVSAYDTETGAQLWRFYTVPGDPANGFEDDTQAMAAKTWTREWWKHGGGGTAWDSLVYDPQGNLLYIGTGNGSPHNRRLRSPQGGDNLFLSSIVAVDADTGRYLWHYQENPAETWDYTATQQITVADIDWEGKKRHVLLHAPKNGFFFVIDAQDGKLLSARKFVPVTWATGYDMATGRPQEVPGQDYSEKETTFYPSSLGAHSWQPMSYSPKTGLVYLPAQHTGMPAKSEAMQLFPKSYNLGNSSTLPPDNSRFVQAMISALQRGYLKAWDPRTQREVWRVEYPRPANGGTLATAGNLVFQGEIGGRLHAYAADTGRELWHTELPAGIVNAPISYSVDGVQYIALEIGLGGAAPMMLGVDFGKRGQPGRVLAFRLDGRSPMPALVPQPPVPEPPPRIVASDDELMHARRLYATHCLRCHGAAAVGNDQVPSLRRLPTAWHDNFERVVRGGMMEPAGMPGFGDALSEDDARVLHAWLINLAWQDKAERETSPWIARVKTWFYERVAAVLAWWLQRDIPQDSDAETISLH